MGVEAIEANKTSLLTLILLRLNIVKQQTRQEKKSQNLNSFIEILNNLRKTLIRPFEFT